MFKNYIKIAWRILVKERLYSIINISGLALGLACFIVVMVYVHYEHSYDHSLSNADQIYRVYQRQNGNNYMGSDFFALTPIQLASVMEDELPEVMFATSIREQSALISSVDQNFWEKGFWADDHFFNVFPYHFITGSFQSALADPNGIVLTKSLAVKLFGNKNPLGESIKYNKDVNCYVTGVIEDPPVNSSFEFSFIINILMNERFNQQLNQSVWISNSFHTFFLTAKSADRNIIQDKLVTLFKKYLDPTYEQYRSKDEYFIQPIPEIHLTSKLNMDIGIKGNKTYLYLFTGIAIAVLLLACINYMSLSIARSMNREREIGVRKVFGAAKTQLIFQFLGETILMTCLSFLLALSLAFFILPVFGHIMDRQLELNLVTDSILLPQLLVLVALVGIFSGLYPAIVTTSFQPIFVLRGGSVRKLSSFAFQRILIVIQFTVTIIMIVGSIVIALQIRQIKKTPLGYDKKDIIAVTIRDVQLFQKYEVLHTQWGQQPDIIATTLSSHLPTNITANNIVTKQDESGNKDKVALFMCETDEDFLKVFGIKLLAGRNISKEITSDHEALLINTSAAKAFGWTPEESIGKSLRDGGSTRMIEGVMNDFHFHSFHLPIKPLAIHFYDDNVHFILIKVKPGKTHEVLGIVESSIKKNSPFPFQYQFLEDNYNLLYESELRLGNLFGFFTILSVFIASLGLFGLSAFVTYQRKKQISLRKIMGASTVSLFVLLQFEFIILVACSFILAVPIAWYITHKWLAGFAYRIELQWWIFVVSGLLAFLIANIAVGSHSWRVSRNNLVQNLKFE